MGGMVTIPKPKWVFFDVFLDCILHKWEFRSHQMRVENAQNHHFGGALAQAIASIHQNWRSTSSIDDLSAGFR